MAAGMAVAVTVTERRGRGGMKDTLHLLHPLICHHSLLVATPSDAGRRKCDE